MKVLFASSEIYPLAKTGGLADVAGALPPALARAKADLRLLMPAYRGVTAAAQAQPVANLGDPFGRGDAVILEGRMPDSGLPVWLVDNPSLFDRDGGPYQDASGADWADNDIRFGLLSWAAARLSHGNSPFDWRPDILHAHDWQTGLAPAYLQAWGGPRPGIAARASARSPARRPTRHRPKQAGRACAAAPPRSEPREARRSGPDNRGP